MSKKAKRNKNANFLIDNKHYKKLHLLVYFLSIFIIVFTYFVCLILFSDIVNIIITSIVSFGVGLFVVLKRNELVNTISDRIETIKRKRYKNEKKMGLKTTLRQIGPSKKNSLKVGVLQEKDVKAKDNNKKKERYINLE